MKRTDVFIKKIPTIIRYQCITKTWLFILAYILKSLRTAILWTSTRSALSSGDIPFMLQSIQGWLVILLGAMTLLLYIVFDVNGMILLSHKLLHDQPVRIRSVLIEAFQSLQYLRQPFGLVVIVYVAFLLPLASVGLGISLTESLHIPYFVTSVIYANVFTRTLYRLVMVAIFFGAYFYVYTFHFMILKKQRVREATKSARKWMRANWKMFIKRYISFLCMSILVGVGFSVVTIALVLGIATLTPLSPDYVFRFWMTFSAFVILGAITLYMNVILSYQFIQLTRIFENEDLHPVTFQYRSFVKLGIFFIGCIAIFIVTSLGMTQDFNTYFPKLGDTQIIAHRAGGNLGNENTVRGIEKAYEAGITASEIDVQRTRDGYYVLNHDNNLQRLTGKDKQVSELTLKEIKKLEVPDFYTSNNTSFSTFDEALDAAKGKVHLYVEFKGKTADWKMVQDLYQKVMEKNMLDEVTFISLKYPLIRHMELTYPKAQTGYLCFAVVGNMEDLGVDELIIEEEIATPETIERIQATGKKVSVWTVNEEVSMMRYYARHVDAIITDEIEEATFIKELVTLQLKGDYTRQIDDIRRIVLQMVFVWIA